MAIGRRAGTDVEVLLHLAPMNRASWPPVTPDRPVRSAPTMPWHAARRLRRRAVRRRERTLTVDQGHARLEQLPHHRPGRRAHRLADRDRRARQPRQGRVGRAVQCASLSPSVCPKPPASRSPACTRKERQCPTPCLRSPSVVPTTPAPCRGNSAPLRPACATGAATTSSSPGSPRASVAGVFAVAVPVTPVDWCKQLLESDTRTARRSCATPATPTLHGFGGETSVQVTVETLADQLGVLPEGLRRLHRRDRGDADDLLRSSLPALAGTVGPSPEAWAASAMPSAPPTPSPRARLAGSTAVEPCRRHRQGQRHDRPRHGDDACLRLHRPARRADTARSSVSRRRSTAASTASRSIPIRRRATRCCSSPPASRSMTTSPTRTIRSWRRSSRHSTQCCSTSPNRSFVTAKAPPSSWRSRSPAPPTTTRQRPLHSPSATHRC